MPLSDPQMAARVAHFVARPPELERMGRNARRHMIEHYSPAEYARRFEALVARRFPGAPFRP